MILDVQMYPMFVSHIDSRHWRVNSDLSQVQCRTQRIPKQIDHDCLTKLPNNLLCASTLNGDPDSEPGETKINKPTRKG